MENVKIKGKNGGKKLRNNKLSIHIVSKQHQLKQITITYVPTYIRLIQTI